jgi:hypothetical protein
MVDTLLASGGRWGQPLSGRSCQLAHGTLRSALQYGVRTGYVQRNVAALVDRPGATAKAMTCWTAAEAQTFLGSLRDDPLFAAWWLLLARGPRRGEVAGLRRSDVVWTPPPSGWCTPGSRSAAGSVSPRRRPTRDAVCSTWTHSCWRCSASTAAGRWRCGWRPGRYGRTAVRLRPGGRPADLEPGKGHAAWTSSAPAAPTASTPTTPTRLVMADMTESGHEEYHHIGCLLPRPEAEAPR